MYENTKKFYEDYPTKEEREKMLMEMTDEEIDTLVDNMPNLYGKIYLSSFKKNKNRKGHAAPEQSAESGDSSELNNSLK